MLRVQLGWISAATHDGSSLSVEAVPEQLPRITTFKSVDWLRTDLLVERVESRLALASEGRGSFESTCQSQVFKVQLAEPLSPSARAKLTVTYLLGKSIPQSEVESFMGNSAELTSLTSLNG